MVEIIRIAAGKRYNPATMVSYSDEQLDIGTPENVTFGYEVAGIGSRFLAALVDTGLIVLLQLITYAVLFFLLRGWLASAGPDLLPGESTTAWLIALFTLLAFGLLWGYYIFFEVTWNGSSPGKRWVSLRVIRSDGSPITLTEAIIRNLVRLIDFLPFYYALGVLTMFVDSRSRRLGDLAAGTLVVRDSGDVTLASLAENRVHSGYESRHGEAIDLPVHRLQERDVRLAEELLRRYATLHQGDEPAQQVLQALYRRMEVSLPATQPAEVRPLISRIVAARRQAGREEG
jgi:uncharacterized RDD family membrane protein YckC